MEKNKKKDGKAMKATWDDSDSSISSDEESENKKVTNICLVAMVEDNALESEEVSATS